MYLWLYVPDVFWFWWNAIGCIVTMIVAWVTSILLKKKANEGLEVVFYSGKKEVGILIGFFILIVIFSLSLPSILS